MRYVGFLVFIACICCSQFSFAQLRINGTVKDSVGKAIPFATISIISNNTGVLVGYVLSQKNGAYSLSVDIGKQKLENFALQVTSVGYKKEIRQLISLSTVYDFLLTDDINQLPQVDVKGQKLKLRIKGDTLSYDASSFTSPQDRVIGDVIKKLPGIEVDNNGKIFYNGKGITNLYIDGDNLLDDKYTIATQSIPSDAVDKVQILENHQPIKALSKLSSTDQVDLNITIKDPAKIRAVGTAKLGIGLPENYDANVTLMDFTKNYKAINYFKTNNIGVDLNDELVSHNIDDTYKNLDVQKPQDILTMGTVQNPNLPQERYLLNRVGVLNTNNLFKLKNDVKLRTNIYYLYDTQHQNYSSQTNIVTPDSNIIYKEDQSSIAYYRKLYGNAVLEINREKYYFKDKLNFSYDNSKYKSSLTANGDLLDQQLTNTTADFSNELNYLKVLPSKNALEVYSYLCRVSNPQELSINPGLNPSYFNVGIPYHNLDQSVRVPSFFSNSYAAFRTESGSLKQSYKLGFISASEHLESDLTRQAYASSLSYVDSARNNLNWSRARVYAETDYQLKLEHLDVNLYLPYNLMHIQYADTANKVSQNLNRIYINPSLTIKYKTGPENFLTAKYSLTNNWGTINQIYSGYILTNYRSLYANASSLTEDVSQSMSIGYNYRKSINMFFMNILATYNQDKFNNISSSIVSQDFERRVVLPINNKVNIYMLNFGISKYLFRLHTTVSAKALYQYKSFEQVLNNELVPYQYQTVTFNGQVNSNIGTKVFINYNIWFNTYKIGTDKSELNATSQLVKQINQKCELNYLVQPNIVLNFTGSDLNNHQSYFKDSNYFFADLNVQYKINKLKTSLEAGLKNISNVKVYNTSIVANNSSSTTSYNVRGRLFMLTASFSF